MKTNLFTRAALAVAVLSCAITAQAQSYTQPNKGGGRIVLSFSPCSLPGSENLLQAYTYIESGKATFGCWMMLDGLVHVAWSDGGRSVYPSYGFTKQEEKATTKPKASL